MSRKTKLKAILSSALVLVIVCGIGAAWAWDVHRVSVDNVLNSHTVDVSIVEEFDSPTVISGTVTKEVDFVNGGSDAVFVRFTYAEYWETATELLDGYTDGDSVVKNWSNTFETDWTDGGDGWYYYNQVLPAWATLKNVLNSVTFGSNIPEDATYTLLFQVETLQVSDEASVNSDATETAFGIEGTVGSDATITNGAITSGSVSWDVPTVSIARTTDILSSDDSLVNAINGAITQSETDSQADTAEEAVSES